MPPWEGEGLPVPEEGDSLFGTWGCKAEGWPSAVASVLPGPGHRSGVTVVPGDTQAGGCW